MTALHLKNQVKRTDLCEKADSHAQLGSSGFVFS